MRKGAIDFLAKPINGAQLLERIQTALEISLAHRQATAARSSFEARLSKLTVREREVLDLVFAGKVNKEIASQLKISSRTIEGHRSRIYLKVGVNSMLELAQLAVRAGVSISDVSSQVSI
jgi:FixJ family two-component response regulator